MHRRNSSDESGFTLTEAVIILTVIGVITCLVVIILKKTYYKAITTSCISNLMMLGQGFHIYAADHSKIFPINFPSENGGSQDWKGSEELYRHYMVLTNYIVNPIAFYCPAENKKEKVRAKYYNRFNNNNISYFLNLEAITKSESIHCGDRNFTIGMKESGKIVNCDSNMSFMWTSELHKYSGNILFGDSHVEFIKNSRLSEIGKNAIYPMVIQYP